jgi:hypothetical protein
VEAGLRLMVRRAVRDYLERAARVVRVQEGGVAVRIRFRCRFSILRIMGVSRFRFRFRFFLVLGHRISEVVFLVGGYAG